MRRRDEQFPDNGFEAWGGYMQAKVAKLEKQFCSKANNEEILSNIFSGVSIYVNGFTVPSADELKTLMSKHGGVYHTYQRSDDFIIASNLPDTKVKNMSLTRVVRPEWITDSIKTKRLLDYRDYLLYKTSRTQGQLNFNKIIKNDVSTTVCNTNTLKNMEKNLIDNSTKLMSEILPTFQNFYGSNDTNSDLCKVNPKFGTLHSDKNIIENFQTKSVADSPKTAADPNFISEFYNNSRLHHISQLSACFKQHVNDLRESSNFIFPARTNLKAIIAEADKLNYLSPIPFEKGKIIMHIDMDCFFVSVGLRNRPDLQGKPVAVTHSKGGQPRPKRSGVDRNTEFNLYRQKQASKLCKATGKSEEINFECRVDNITDEDEKYGSMSEIASCSYDARAKGIKNGMFMGAALKLCPDIQTIPYDFEAYKEVAYTLYTTIAQYTLDIEAVSCDEMYVDCTELLKYINASVQGFATAIRNEIKIKTGCPCSTGFGGNRLQARLATKRAKPDGQFFLSEDLVEDFIFDIKLSDLPGVGRQISHKLELLGHSTCGSLQQLSLSSLKSHLGNKTGAQLFDQCRGRDANPLTFHTIRKSVSAEVNYGIRFVNNDQCIEFLKQLSAEVHTRMQQFKVLGKCITLKLMVRAEEAPIETAKFMGHGFCNIINKSASLNSATNDINIISKEVIGLCRKLNVDPKEMRGLGIQITRLEPIISKETKGAISKFLCNNIKTFKFENVNKSHYNYSKEALNTIKDELDIKYESNPFEKKPKVATPKKHKTKNSPEQKSPILALKSPIRKRRGRPSKGFKLQQSTSKNLMSKFLQGQNNTRDTPFKDPMLKNNTNQEIIKKEIPQENKTNIYEDSPQGLLGLPWDKVRELLRAWLDSGQTPLPWDVNLIAEYMREMVVNKNLEKLYVLVNFLKRRTHELVSSDWIEVYNHVMEEVQNAMIAVYGKRLLICD